MENTQTSASVWIILALIIGLALGGVGGYYYAQMQAPQEAAVAPDDTNPFDEVQTNPLQDVKTNPFE